MNHPSRLAPKVGRAIFELTNPIVRTFPIVAEEGASYPFMVYRRTSLTPYTTKDRFNYLTQISMELVIVTQKYEEGVALSQEVWDALDKKGGNIGGLDISAIRVTSSSEDFANNAYIQRLQIEVDVE